MPLPQGKMHMSVSALDYVEQVTGGGLHVHRSANHSFHSTLILLYTLIHRPRSCSSPAMASNRSASSYLSVSLSFVSSSFPSTPHLCRSSLTHSPRLTFAADTAGCTSIPAFSSSCCALSARGATDSTAVCAACPTIGSAALIPRLTSCEVKLKRDEPS